MHANSLRNLRPISAMTEIERRAFQQKGGIASVQKRKKQKQMYERLLSQLVIWGLLDDLEEFQKWKSKKEKEADLDVLDFSDLDVDFSDFDVDFSDFE